MPSQASAQDPVKVASERAMDEDDGAIIVTARRRDEALQDVPISITSIGGESLEKSQISKPEALAARVPTLNIAVGGSGSGGQLSLRGIGSSNVSAAFDSAVALDFDGIVVSSMRLVQAGFFDVAQIDVLKGPQSLYFGKSATAGVVSIRSADPTSSFEAGLRGSYEFEEKGYTAEGYVSGPISDSLGYRIAVRYNKVDELYFNAAPNVANPYRGEENLNIRGTLEFEPSDSFKFNIKANYVGHRNDGEVRHTQIFCGPNGVADPLVLLGGAVVVPAGYDCNAFDNTFWLPDSAPQLSRKGPPGMDNNGGVPFNETDIYLLRARADIGLSDSLSLALVTGYFDFESRGQDFYGYGGVFGVGTDLNHNRTEQFTQEVRFSSDNDGPLNWLLGGFYERRSILFEAAQNAVNISFLAPDPVTGSTFDWRRLHFTKTDAFSLFGNLLVEPTDRIELSAGVRYTKEEKVNRIEVPYVHAVLSRPPFNFLRSGFQSPQIRFDDENFSPEISVKYEVSNNAQVYAVYKKGFKSGGIDNSALPSSGLSAIVASGDYSRLMFDSETAEGFEIGLKSTLAQNRLRLNVSLFNYVFSDLQIQSFDPVAIQYSTSNAGELRSRGGDIDLSWRAPVDGLTLSAAVAYTDAEFTDTYISNAGVDLNGRAAPRAPKWSGNVSFDWNLPVGDNLKLSLFGLANYSGSYFADATTLNDYVQNDYVTLDANISIGAPDDRWRLSLIGNNLTDKIYVNQASGRPFRQALIGDDLALTQNRGRQVFVELAFKY
ncbi:TonB-dependent receptor [Sphingomonas sp. ID1715]|nr:TonB-dependent receptor [Sphingomonas sp. ID1715]